MCIRKKCVEIANKWVSWVELYVWYVRILYFLFFNRLIKRKKITCLYLMYNKWMSTGIKYIAYREVETFFFFFWINQSNYELLLSCSNKYRRAPTHLTCLNTATDFLLVNVHWCVFITLYAAYSIYACTNWFVWKYYWIFTNWLQIWTKTQHFLEPRTAITA